MGSKHRLCHPVQATVRRAEFHAYASAQNQFLKGSSALAVIWDMRKIQQSFGLTCRDTSRRAQKKHI
jgi:hypothetical protein